MNTICQLLGTLNSGITLVDIGCSGGIEAKWRPLHRLLNIIGFDPNEAECRRLNAMPHPYRSARFLPYAIGGGTRAATLYRTHAPYCYSLLAPRTEWVRRFAYAGMFELEGTEEISVRTLGEVPELQAIDVDALKLDTQGLELPILRSSEKTLREVFYLETETGFTENYQGETTYAEIDLFLRAQGFLLFDINPFHRVARNNEMQASLTGREEILWCEAVWLKDYVALACSNPSAVRAISRDKAIRVLGLCAAQGCFDYGLELARLFHEFGQVERMEVTRLSKPREWRLSPRFLSPAFNFFLRCLPGRVRLALYRELNITFGQKSVLRMLIGQ
jgi:FkbM family methyltransferase